MSERERQQASGEWRVPVGGEETSAVFDPATTGAEKGIVFVCAHGAGGSMNDRAVAQTANALRERGIGVVRFNFLYKEKKSKRPDLMPRLKECFSAVVSRVRDELKPRVLIIGGRSMGGRAASMMAAEGFECEGLLLLAYPLHPPGRPEQLRDAHLPAIRVPVICFSGTRDPFCTPSLMEEVLERVTTDWEMHWVEGADHSFHVLKSSGKTDAQVLGEIADAAQAWVKRIDAAQKTANKRPAAPAERSLVIKRTFDAPRDLVWKVWSDPEQAKKWWGPDGFTAPVVELDTRPGGKWRAMMRSPDGKELWQHGVYREIVPPEKVSFTYIWDAEPEHEMLITITFAESGERTEMTFQQTGFRSVDERNGHEGGWSQSFGRFAAYLKSVKGANNAR